MSQEAKEAEAVVGDFTQTPEFKAAVAAAVAAAAPQIAAAALAQVPQPTASGEMGALIEAFAMSVSNLTNQGTGIKPVAPELIRSREEGTERMFALIRKAREEGRTATYRLRGKIFFGEEVIEPNFVRASDHTYQPTEVDWDSVPNQSMEPLNDTAREIYAAFEQSIAGTLRPVRPLEGMLITGRVVVKNDPNRQIAAPSPEEIKAGVAIEHAAMNGLRIHREDPAGYQKQQILGTTSAGVAFVTK
jgi:hypothetical protein